MVMRRKQYRRGEIQKPGQLVTKQSRLSYLQTATTNMVKIFWS